MADFTLKEWMRYKDNLRKISDKAVDELEKYVIKNGGYANIPRQELINHVYALSTRYGEASAALSAEMYDAVAMVQHAAVPAAVPAATADYGKVSETVNGIIKNTASENTLIQSVGLLVKDAGQKTTIQNARRDNAEIAFICTGDTCAWCIMLAAKGWQRASASDLNKDGEPAHLHANCDCTYGVRFNDSMKYSGYDPQKFERMYYDAPLDPFETPTAKNRLKALRRQIYKQQHDTDE